MRLGLGLGIGLTEILGTSVYDPTVLTVQGFWRGSYLASPWNGTASAGGSGARTLTEATHPPTAGSPVNGFTPADFGGVNQLLQGAAVSTYCGVNAIYGWALVYVRNITTNSTGGASLANDVLWITSSTGQSGIFFRDPGSSPKVGIHVLTTGLGSFVAETSITKSTWQLVQWKWDGTTVSIRVNGGTWSTNSLGTAPANSLGNNLTLARNSGNSVFTDMQVEELALTGSGGESLSNANFDNVLSYARSRYGLTLT